MQFSLSAVKHVHMVGVGGIGMSGLARLFLHEKKGVSGSDSAMSAITQALENEGVDFFSDQGAHNITDTVDLVVYTEAMPEDHPELMAAREKGIHTINYFEALGLVANEYYLIAVAGTHGKTTTTAMLIDILEEASFDPTAIVGSLRSKSQSNFRAGKSKYFVVEACEYKRDFLYLEPDVLVITNLEAEHLDYYKNLQDVQSAFRELAMKVQEDGAIVVNTADANVMQAISQIQKKNAGPVEVIDYGKYFDPMMQIPQPGLHNKMNAAAAAAAASFLGVQEKFIKSALENFSGTWRRFEYKGEMNGAAVYDDYAHHPTEIDVTITAVKEVYPDKQVVAVFQPHLASRTAALTDDFVAALAKADRVLIAPTYAAREQDVEGVTSEGLADRVREVNVETMCFKNFDAIEKEVRETVGEESIVLVMGAGSIAALATKLTVPAID